MKKDFLVSVVVPVYNEEEVLTDSIHKLVDYLTKNLPYNWNITIADNASIDGTRKVGESLASKDNRVYYVALPQKGRGGALRKTWLDSKADVVSYMDVDLSTNLNSFKPLIDAIIHDKNDIAIGSRLKKGAHVTRQWKREVVSRCYNFLIWCLFPSRTFSDSQCGFKAMSRRAADTLLPLVKNNKWFFDSELLLRANELGLKIAEIPVEWIDDLDTRVKIVETAIEDIKGLLRVRFTPVARLNSIHIK